MRILFLLPLLCLPLSVAAQTPDSVCVAIRQVSVGIWAEYDLQGVAGQEAHGRVRNAIVGSERSGDTTFWWHESLVRAEEGTLIIKTLIPGLPLDPAQARDLIMKMDDEPAMRMPEHMMALMRAEEGPADQTQMTAAECASAENLGWEEIETPAGPLRALHIRTATDDGEPVDAWITPMVPFGLVRFSGGGVELTLVGHGTGATTAITETPREMD